MGTLAIEKFSTSNRLHRYALAITLFSCAMVAATRPALAWSDEGHRVIALGAERLLDPEVREKVSTMLASDTDSLTGHDIASEATWADRYRDSDRRGSRPAQACVVDKIDQFVAELTDPRTDPEERPVAEVPAASGR